jgi:hypothetical protein
MFQQTQIWSLFQVYDHRKKIMLHNVIKKMTEALSPDFNAKRRSKQSPNEKTSKQAKS